MNAVNLVDDSGFRLLFSANPLPIWVYDLDTHAFLEVNDAAIAHYGYSREEFLAMRVTDIRPVEDIEKLLAHDAHLPGGASDDIRRHAARWRHRLKDGTIRDVEIAAQTIVFAGRRATLVVANDVTDRDRTEKALLAYSERVALLHEIDLAILGARTPVEIAESALRRLRDLLDVPRAIVNLIDLAKNEAEWLVAVGRRRVHSRPDMRFPLVYLGDVEGLKRGEVQTLETAKLPPGPEVEALLGSGVNFYMVVPMLADGQLIGGLSFGGAASQFSAEQLDIAQQVAAQLAIALSHARLHEDVQRHALELEARVRERTIELREANARLTHEIDERRRAQVEADRANRLKSEFLANMSHELRTPLNAIIGFTELIHDDLVAPGSPQFKEFLGDILASARHLLRLINDVLDLSKIEAGKLEFHPEPVDLRTLVDELLAIMRGTAAAKNIRIEAEIGPVADVVIDPARLKQILYNYLSNALKFSADGGRVAVRVVPHDDRCFRLEVEDSGVGIAPEDVGRLFVEFQQLDGGLAKRHEGTGLGLALTKRLAEAQGGSVGVHSTPGTGSRFYAILPMRANVKPVAAATAELPPADADWPVILVVEDSERDRAAIAKTLASAGYCVELATTGAQALAKCRERAFDAITLDLLLPDMSGLEVLDAIRSSTRNGEVPVIVVTVVTERGAVAGFAVHDLLAKPLDPRALLESLHRAHVGAAGSGDVLVVDDDAGSRRLMSAALAQLGYSARCASSGDEALCAVEAAKPLAVVLDLMMPGMNGFEFLERFHAIADCRDVPVFVWTAKDLSVDEYAQLQSTVQRVVAKGRSGIGGVIDELRLFLDVSRSEPTNADT